MPAKLTLSDFIRKANIKHNNKYNYSLVNYVNAITKISIICPKHGMFEQQPNNHMFGQGCIKCMGDNVRKARINDTKTFVNNAKKIHGNRYDYSLVNYKTGKDKVIIVCSKHGEFLQTPFAHASLSMKQGCPYCKISKGEDEIEKYLIKQNIKYIREYRIDNCINPKTNKKLPFDFYLSDYNIIIEYHGEQHYKKMGSYFETKNGGLKERQYRDNIKKQYCIDNDIIYLNISYLNLNNIVNILNDKL